MPRYVLVNRRAGMYTSDEKHRSRHAVSATLSALEGSSRILADRNPADSLARRVVVLDADEATIARMRSTLSPDAIIEPLIRRKLQLRTPIELNAALLQAPADGTPYRVRVTGGGNPLAGIQVMFYVAAANAPGQFAIQNETTDASGWASTLVPGGSSVAFVEPIPYAGFWITLAEAPGDGSTVDCPAIAGASPGGAGWWHGAMGIDVGDMARGAGIRVGVIDTGCGPHPNLMHVHLIGAFTNGQILPPDQGADVAEHGTHTTGIIGARPVLAGDYAGIAAGCELFHARVFASEDDGPTQADLINAIDALSRDNQCDLINMSLGGGPSSQAEEDAIRDAAERGTLCVCSAGNENGPIDFPAAYSECAAVSAIGLLGWAPAGTFSAGNRPQQADRLGQNHLFLASFSCFGPTLACAGPGVGIVSTVPDRAGDTGLYMEMDGTSMASPAACGALTVILASDPLYKTTDRDSSRTSAARSLLAQHCEPFGLAVQYEGRGLPKV